MTVNKKELCCVKLLKMVEALENKVWELNNELEINNSKHRDEIGELSGIVNRLFTSEVELKVENKKLKEIIKKLLLINEVLRCKRIDKEKGGV